MNPLGAIILVVLIGIVLGASRRAALMGMMAGVLYLTEAQQLKVLDFNLYALRFLELAGFIRVLSRREFAFRQLTRIDLALLLLYGYTTVVFLLRSSEGVANQIGVTVDALLCYFTFRGLIWGMDDLRWFLRAFIILLAPYALLVLIESFTGHNPFTLLGGVEGGSNWTRHGRPRCFGSFQQPDTLGMFAGSFLALFIGLACIPRERKRAALGVFLCLIIVWAANAGGAASAAGMAVLGWLFWRYRTRMQTVRRGVVVLLVLLALVMKAPIWYVFARASSVTGGDGWHRSYLIDMAWQHRGQWWLGGLPVKETGGWMPYNLAMTGGADITNQYLAFGVAAGVGAVILFVFLLKRAFGALGLALAAVRSVPAVPDETEYLLWGLGVVLIVHIINWFGISYFDQMSVIWFMQLAVVSTLTDQVVKAGKLMPTEARVHEAANLWPSRSAPTMS